MVNIDNREHVFGHGEERRGGYSEIFKQGNKTETTRDTNKDQYGKDYFS